MARKVMMIVGLLLVLGAAAVTAQNPVTFQCNMNIQIGMGNFVPETDMLVIRGSFNGWAGDADQMTDPDLDGIYTLVRDFPDTDIGTLFEFKYVIAPDGWESVGNRTFTLETSGNTLDVHFYNDQETMSVTANVTFQADMSDLLDKGYFDPGQDSIRVVGSMNGWGNAESMEPDIFDPALYIYPLAITAGAGSEVNWKFRTFPDTRWIDGGWEMGSNHVFEFTGEDLVLDPLLPNCAPSGSPLSQDVTVNFTVDVNNAVDYYNRNPFQNIHSVWVTGDWNNWGGSWSVDDTTALLRMYDDGTHMDEVAGDGIWSNDVLFASGASSAILYKYAIFADGVDTLNGSTSPMDNEAGFAMNHFLLISDAGPTFTPPTDIFGSQWNQTGVEEIGLLPGEFELGQNYPNPFNPTTHFEYALPREAQVRIAIYNTMGHRVMTLVDEKQGAGVYRVRWNGTDGSGNRVTSGIYFYRVEAGSYTATKKMMMLK